MTFRQTWRGYDQHAVDQEIAGLRKRVRDLQAERDDLVAELRAVRSAAGLVTTSDESDSVRPAGDILQRASETARQTVEQAERQAEKVRTEATLEAARAKSEAARQAEAMVRSARDQAALVEERSRQELAWRRRQLHRETEEVGRRQRELVSRLASVKALAAETAQSLPDLSDLDLGVDDDGGDGPPSAPGTRETEAADPQAPA